MMSHRASSVCPRAINVRTLFVMAKSVSECSEDFGTCWEVSLVLGVDSVVELSDVSLATS